MNDALIVYLATYFEIGLMDHLIKNCRVFYRSWKYWYSPMLHEKYLAIVVAYGIYKEYVEGGIDSEWEIEHPIDFWTFIDVLSKQILQYSPTHQLFPGDKKTRASKAQTIRKQGRVTGELECLENVTHYILDTEKNKPSTRSGSTRFCGYLTGFERCVES